MQPGAELLDGGGLAGDEHFDGAVRQVLRDPADAEPLCFETRAVAEVDPLNFSRDEETPDHCVHLRGGVVGVSAAASRAHRRAAR